MTTNDSETNDDGTRGCRARLERGVEEEVVEAVPAVMMGARYVGAGYEGDDLTWCVKVP